jgi:ribonuclease R
MFVKLSNLVEGRVGYNTMDDYYIYEENCHMLIGQRKGKKYNLGDRIAINVVKTDKDIREIDFELVDNKANQRRMGDRNRNNK